MKVIMKTTACGPNLMLEAGKPYNLRAEMAEKFIANGNAIPAPSIDDDKIEDGWVDADAVELKG